MRMYTNCKILHSLVLVLIANVTVAQANLVQNISASVGISFPVGSFGRDVPGEGHGFANPGVAADVFYNICRADRKLSYLAGLIVINNPLDRKNMTAMWSPTTTIEAKNYNLFGFSGGVLLELPTTERLVWHIRATVGLASIQYPAHTLREPAGGRPLIYRSSADNSINLNGSLGLLANCKISPKMRLGGQLDFFRSRARHIITYVADTYPPSYEDDHMQQIAIVNLKIAACYSL